MNKEFMLIDGIKKVIITDEKGKINFKNLDEFSKESLLLENRVQIIENNISTLNEKLMENKKIIWLSKKMLNVNGFIFLLIFVLSIIFGITIPNFFEGNSILDVFDVLYSYIILVEIVFAVCKSVFKRRVKNINVQLELLKKIEEKVKKESVSKKFDISRIKENEPVSLIEETNKYEIETNTLLKNIYRDSKKQEAIYCDDIFSKYPISGNWDELVKYYNVTTDEDMEKLYAAVYYLNFDYKRLGLNYKIKNKLFYYLELEKIYEKNHGVSMRREKNSKK